MCVRARPNNKIAHKRNWKYYECVRRRRECARVNTAIIITLNVRVCSSVGRRINIPNEIVHFLQMKRTSAYVACDDSSWLDSSTLSRRYAYAIKWLEWAYRSRGSCLATTQIICTSAYRLRPLVSFLRSASLNMRLSNKHALLRSSSRYSHMHISINGRFSTKHIHLFGTAESRNAIERSKQNRKTQTNCVINKCICAVCRCDASHIKCVCDAKRRWERRRDDH